MPNSPRFVIFQMTPSQFVNASELQKNKNPHFLTHTPFLCSTTYLPRARVNSDPRPSLTHANPPTPHFLSSSSPPEFRMSFAAPLASTIFSRFFRPFSTNRTRSFSPSETQSRDMSNTQIATVAAGCFWGVEHLYRKHFGNGKGLLDARVGYCGGETPAPSYRAVCTGQSGRKYPCDTSPRSLSRRGPQRRH